MPTIITLLVRCFFYETFKLFLTTLRTLGTRPAALQQKAYTLAEACFSADIVSRRLLSAVERLTGMPRALFEAGGQLREANMTRSRNEQQTAPERAQRSDAVPLDWVWSWFHTHSPDVQKFSPTSLRNGSTRVNAL